MKKQLKAMDVCRTDLFTAEDELRERFSEHIVNRVLRIREEYNWFISNPDTKDKQFVDVMMGRHNIKKSEAYDDLSIIKTLLPNITKASRDFHRFRYNEMILETYQMAKKRKDTKTMERAASSYGKYNRIDIEDEVAVPYDVIVVQPFTATDDPRVLGIEPIPNIKKKIADMIRKYKAESIDIEDVKYEEADLEEDELYAEPVTFSDSEFIEQENGEESLL